MFRYVDVPCLCLSICILKHTHTQTHRERELFFLEKQLIFWQFVYDIGQLQKACINISKYSSFVTDLQLRQDRINPSPHP